MFLVHQVGGGRLVAVRGALRDDGGYGAASSSAALLLIAALLSITINERRLVPQLVPWREAGDGHARPECLVVIDAQQEYFAPLGKVVLPDGPARCSASRARSSGRAARASRWCTSSTRAGGPIRRPSRRAARRWRSTRPRAGPGEPVMTKHLPGSFTGPGSKRSCASADRAAARQRLHDPDVRGHHGAAGRASRLWRDRAPTPARPWR